MEFLHGNSEENSQLWDFKHGHSEENSHISAFHNGISNMGILKWKLRKKQSNMENLRYSEERISAAFTNHAITRIATITARAISKSLTNFLSLSHLS